MPQLGETLDALAEAEGEAPFSWTVWSWYFFYHYHNSNIIIMKSFKCDHLIKRHLQDEVENLSLVVGLAAWVHSS